MKNILPIFKKVLLVISKPSFWVHLPKNSIIFIKKASVTSVIFASFFLLLNVCFVEVICKYLESLPVVGRIFKKTNMLWVKSFGRYIPRLVRGLEKMRTYEVQRSYLIFLAFENLRVRKSRSLITVAGMSFGVGVIVLLLSLGYGIERLVVNKVASLQDLQVVDISTGGNTAVKLTQDAMRKFQKFGKVTNAIPFVSVVGRITFNKATTDVLVYSAPNEYFKFINAKMVKGKLFSNNKISYAPPDGEVAGVSTQYEKAEFGSKVSPNTVLFNINPQEAAVVWESCSTGGKIVGYTARLEGGYKGYQYWGSEYYPLEGDARAGYSNTTHEYLGKWIKGVVPLYNKSSDGALRPILDDHGVHKWQDACIQMKYVQVLDEYILRQVLGASTKSGSVLAASDSASITAEADIESSQDSSSSAEIDQVDSAAFISSFDSSVVGTNSSGIEFVDLASQQKAKKKETETLKFKGGHSGEAIVSTGLLNLLGIPVSKALDSTFKSSLIIGKSQIPELLGKAQSEEKEYRIVGVIDDLDTQYFYIPLSDVKNLGVTNFSQAKIVMLLKQEMGKFRKQVEDLGFRTTSTADTVKQIESLFGNLRIVLGLLGMVALGVASLGMFNTLTVSLLERTREIGGMKTIGMVTDEVQELLLSEAMIMGLSGGVGGLLLGFVAGKVLSGAVSIFAIAGGQGFLDLTYVPPFLILFIIVSSFFVGLITGLYPAMRARKISALNALRYE